MKRIILLILLCSYGQFAIGQTGGGLVSDKSYFEGSINFHFTVTGKDAAHLTKTNKIDNLQLHIKDGDFIIQEYGYPDPQIPAKDQQIFSTTRLYIGDSDRVYVVDAPNQRAFSKEKYKPKSNEIPVAEPLGDSIMLMGMWCYGYKVIKKDEEITYYVNTNYRVNLKYYANKVNARHAFLTIGLNGCIPLKTIRTSKRYRLVVTVNNIKVQKYKEANFRIPASFRILGYDYRR